MNHIHKYIKKRIGKNKYEVFACGFADCTHFIPASLALGKRSICWRCGIEMIITNIRLTKQHCINCTKGRKVNDVELLRGLEGLINEKVS